MRLQNIVSWPVIIDDVELRVSIEFQEFATHTCVDNIEAYVLIRSSEFLW